MKKQISVVTKVIRQNPQFLRLVTSPLNVIEPWKLSGTSTVEDTINETDLGRRSLKRWDERNCWWIDLPDSLCKEAGLDTGDEASLPICLASEEMREELHELLKSNAVAKGKWEKLTEPAATNASQAASGKVTHLKATVKA